MHDKQSILEWLKNSHYHSIVLVERASTPTFGWFSIYLVDEDGYFDFTWRIGVLLGKQAITKNNQYTLKIRRRFEPARNELTKDLAPFFSPDIKTYVL